MLYILDTDVLSNLRKEKRHPGVLTWVQCNGWRQLSTTVINLAEIQYGIERQMPSNPLYAEGTRIWMQRLLQAGSPAVWPLDLSAALTLARMYEAPALEHDRFRLLNLKR